jgi:hypothetical protein
MKWAGQVTKRGAPVRRFLMNARSNIGGELFW